VKKKVLGRGLEALISQDLRETVSEVERVKELDLDSIDPNPNQPRESFDDDALRELAESIKHNGILQPIVVRRRGGRYELILGERRLRAAKMAGLSSVPALIRDVDDSTSLKFALLENLQRENLNPIEEAKGYERLKEQFGLSAKSIAELIGKDRSTITNSMRILKLPEPIRDLVASGQIGASHARTLLSMDDEEKQIELARQIAEEGLSVREIEVHVGGKSRVKRKKGKAKRDSRITELEEQLEMQLGTRVRIVPRRRGGVLVMEYYSDEELERLLELIGVTIKP